MTDVLVVGGGPAGATAAAILASHGVDVTLVEKARFPRHHVGESLQPATLEVLEKHLGLRKTIDNAGFQRKYGAWYIWGETREPWTVLFDARLNAQLPDSEEALLSGDYEHSYQVERATFDQILMDEARRRGVDVRENVDVARPVMVGDRVVGVETKGGEVLYADLVVDASGQRSLIGRHLKLTQVVPDLQATATYAYFDGCGGLDGPLGRNVQLVATIDAGWVWFIPLSATRTSVGIVVQERRKLDRDEFMTLLKGSGLPLDGSGLATPLFHARDWSYCHRQAAGPGWVMVGDAASFIDPILAGGVDFAVRGAADLALAVLRVRSGDDAAAVFKSYSDRVRTLYKAHLRLARYWYGNNRCSGGLFWEAHRVIRADAVSTPLRAFVYLTSGHYAADQHFAVFQRWQEEKMFKALQVDKARLATAWKEGT